MIIIHDVNDQAGGGPGVLLIPSRLSEHNRTLVAGVPGLVTGFVALMCEFDPEVWRAEQTELPPRGAGQA